MNLGTSLTAFGGDSGSSSTTRRCFGTPRLRKEWQLPDSEDTPKVIGECPLLGRVTREEGMWGVIVTMGIAAMRNNILQNHDVEWYVLHFFCFWGPMSSSVMYSTRFNDEDSFHTFLWSGFLVGMFGQVAYLDSNLGGFAGSTCFLYLLFAIANFRLVWCLPRARMFCGFFGSICTLSAFVFAALANSSDTAMVWERVLLRAHACLEPLSVLTYVAITRRPELQQRWDIPLCIEHVIDRFQGFHMMIIVCSFLFPIGLCGITFEGDMMGPSVGAVTCANVYALLMKLVVFDVGFLDASEEGGLEGHPIRRSRYTALAFVHTFSLSMLGIALSGVGFVAAIKKENINFTQPVLCGGVSLTWFMMAFNSLLHSASNTRMHRQQTSTLFLSSFASLIPWIFGFSQSATLVFIVLDVLFLLVLLVACRVATQEPGARHGWHWRSPKFRLKQDVSSHEHFFTIFFAVCIFQLNALVGANHDMEMFFLVFMMFYLVIQISMRYAGRFNDNDASHKLLWSLYQYGLLLMLEFIGSDSRRSFEYATAGVVMLMGFACSLRTAFYIPSVRYFCTYFAMIYLLLVAVLLYDCAHGSGLRSWLWVYIAFSVWADLSIIILSYYFDNFNIPTSIDYIVSRFDGLFLEVLGVALIVPAAIYPGAYVHSTLVLLGDMSAALLAIVLKIGFFDVETGDFERHAMRRAKWSAIIFVNLMPLTLFGLCMIGASLPLLITSAGMHGPSSKDVFAQKLLCAGSCLTWASLSLTKLLHKSVANLKIHRAKAFVQAAGAIASMLQFLREGASDVGLLCGIVCLNSGVVITEVLLQRCGQSHAPLDEYDTSFLGVGNSLNTESLVENALNRESSNCSMARQVSGLL